MKKFLTLLLVSIFYTVPVFAQELDDPNTGRGNTPVIVRNQQPQQNEEEQTTTRPHNLIKRGKSFSISIAPTVMGYYFTPMKQDEKFTIDGGWGYGGGLAINARFGRRTSSSRGGTGKFSIETGFFYHAYPLTIKARKTSEKVTFNQYSIPLLFQLRFGNSKIELGPEFSALLNTSPKSVIIDSNRYDFSKMTGYMTNIVFGYGYSLKKLDMGLRMAIPLTKYADNFEFSPFSIQLVLSYYIPIIK